MSEEWYYMSNGQQQGPISAIALRQMASVGMLLPEDMVTKSGMASWVPASRVKGLFQVSAQVSPSTASPPASVPPNQSQPQSPSNSTNSFNQFPPPLPSNSGPNLVPQMPASPLPTASMPASPPVQLNSSPAEIPVIFPSGVQDHPSSSVPPPLLPTVQTKKSFSSPISGAFGNLKSLWSSSAASNTSSSSNELSVPNTSTPIPPRLPEGLDAVSVLFDFTAVYQGGHPELHNKAEGRILLAETGFYFVGEIATHDLVLPIYRIRDVLKPIVGAYPQKMVDQANTAKAAAQIGAGVAKFAGTMMGGSGGRLVKAAGGAGSDAVKGTTALGPPPRNRLTIVFLDSNDFAHKILIDISGANKAEMEQRAESFWMRLSPLRPRFHGAAKATSASKQTIRKTAGTSSDMNFAEGEYRVLVPGNPVETYSAKELSEKLTNGSLGAGTLVCVELWVSVNNLATFSNLAGTGVGGIGTKKATKGGPNEEGEGTSNSNSGSAKGKNSKLKGTSGVGTALAAGVAGAVVGAMAGAALSNAMGKKKVGPGVAVNPDETASTEETDAADDEVAEDSIDVDDGESMDADLAEDTSEDQNEEDNSGEEEAEEEIHEEVDDNEADESDDDQDSDDDVAEDDSYDE